MKLPATVLSTLALTAILIVGASLALGDQGGKPPPNTTPPPPSPNAPVSSERPIWVPEQSTQPGPDSGPGVTVKGKFVPIPAEASVITTIGEFGGPTVHIAEVRYRNSKVSWDEDGVVVEKKVEKQDEVALKPLLDALGP